MAEPLLRSGPAWLDEGRPDKWSVPAGPKYLMARRWTAHVSRRDIRWGGYRAVCGQDKWVLSLATNLSPCGIADYEGGPPTAAPRRRNSRRSPPTRCCVI